MAQEHSADKRNDAQTDQRDHCSMQQRSRSLHESHCQADKSCHSDRELVCWIKRKSLPTCFPGLNNESSCSWSHLERSFKTNKGMSTKANQYNTEGGSPNRYNPARKLELKPGKQRSFNRSHPKQKTKSMSWGEYFISMKELRESNMTSQPDVRWTRESDSLHWQCTVSQHSPAKHDPRHEGLSCIVFYWIEMIFRVLSSIVLYLFSSKASKAQLKQREVPTGDSVSETPQAHKDTQELQDLLKHAQQNGFVVLTNNDSSAQRDFSELHSSLQEESTHCEFLAAGLSTSAQPREQVATSKNLLKS
eukprot:751829-Hanusia_phi.AAC.3